MLRLTSGVVPLLSPEKTHQPYYPEIALGYYRPSTRHVGTHLTTVFEPLARVTLFLLKTKTFGGLFSAA